MAGTVTYTVEQERVIKTIRWDWLSDAAGDADLQTTERVNGEILRIVFIPDGGGTQPTDNYDVVLNDEDSADAANGCGANLSNAAPVNRAPMVTNGTDGNATPAVCDSKLDCVVSGAGNAKGGQVVVYFRGELGS